MGRIWVWMLALVWACADEREPAEIPPFAACETPKLAGSAVAKVRGASVIVGGQAVVPHGVGSYPLLEHAATSHLERVRDVFAQARALGRPLVRTNAFWDGPQPRGPLRDARGRLREDGLRGLDALLDEARRAEVRLLLVLTNYWEDYGGARVVLDAVAPGEDLPTEAFFSDPRAISAQRRYVQALVSRTNTVNGVAYAKDPTIFAWELINEARCGDRAYCDRDTLPSWAKQMSSAIREAGASQLVAWGGSGYTNRHGERLEDIGRRGGVDILTVHVYPGALRPKLLREPAEPRVRHAIDVGARHMQAAFDVAEALEMPLLVEELGYAPPAGQGRDAERAEVYRAFLALAHARGVATLPWMVAEAGREDYDGYLIRERDAATLEVLGCE